MAVIFDRTPVLTDVPFHYCPGCGHGIVHRMVAEVIDELGIRNKTAGVAPVGCAVFMYNYMDVDMYEAAHGRAPAVATGYKRVHPDNFIFTYQGDGDLASIGTAEIVHAAHRGEKITTIFINNAIYGMTGGQMAPTSLVGQKTTTSPYGRSKEHCGEPIRMHRQHHPLQGCHQEGLPDPDRPQGLLHGRDPVPLPHQLGQVSGRVHAVAGREHDSLLPARHV